MDSDPSPGVVKFPETFLQLLAMLRLLTEFGKRSFSYIVVATLNSFRRQLKTYYFSSAFNS